MASKYGKIIVGDMLSDAQALGYGGSALDSTNMVNVGGQLDGRLWIDVYAQTAISIASGEYWYVELETFSADTAASAIAPFSADNQGGINGASGTAETNAHQYLLHKTSADGQLDFSAGDFIGQLAVPEDMMRLLGHTFVQLKQITDKTDPGTDETIDAFVYVKP